MRVGLTSSSWASRWGSTGSSATMRTASIARASSDAISCVPSVVALRFDQERVAGEHVVELLVAQPGDLDLAEVAGLVELDHPLLEQLEHGQEPHDELEPLGEAGGETTEGDATRSGKLVEQLDHRVAHAGPDGRD